MTKHREEIDWSSVVDGWVIKGTLTKIPRDNFKIFCEWDEKN